MKKYTYYVIALLALFVSCDDAEFEFSSDSCYFIFDNSANRSPMLGTAMNSLSPGVFCHAAVSGRYFVFNTNTAPGQTERVAFNAVDEQRTLILGAYNESGIIVGYGNLNSPAIFYAYDNQCPQLLQGEQPAALRTYDGHNRQGDMQELQARVRHEQRRNHIQRRSRRQTYTLQMQYNGPDRRAFGH